MARVPDCAGLCYWLPVGLRRTRQIATANSVRSVRLSALARTRNVLCGRYRAWPRTRPDRLDSCCCPDRVDNGDRCRQGERDTCGRTGLHRSSSTGETRSDSRGESRRCACALSNETTRRLLLWAASAVVAYRATARELRRPRRLQGVRAGSDDRELLRRGVGQILDSGAVTAG